MGNRQIMQGSGLEEKVTFVSLHVQAISMDVFKFSNSNIRASRGFPVFDEMHYRESRL